MLALVYDGEVRVVKDYPEPVAQPGEALLKVRLAGVCRTDLEIAKGYMDFRGVMGHECVADVVDGPDDWPGRRVVVEINCPCGTCAPCRAGRGTHCPGRTVLGIDGRDGVFAELVTAPAANLHAVPDSLSDEQAVFAEPLAAACRILEQVDVTKTSRVVVLGDGRLGQLCARVLVTRASDLTLVGKHAAKLDIARRGGIAAVDLAAFDAAGDVDIVVDATGRADGLDLAMRSVRPLGTIVLKSTFAGPGRTNLAPLVIDEVTVVGSRCGQLEAALAALAAGDVTVTDLITSREPLSAAGKALSAGGGDQLKVLIDVAAAR